MSNSGPADRRTRKSIRDETAKLEQEQGKHLEAAAQNVSDQHEVAKVAKKHKGATAEGVSAARTHLESATGQLAAKFKENTVQRAEVGKTLDESAKEQVQQRDVSYNDAQTLADGAGAVKDKAIKKELGQARDASSYDAKFFNEQGQARVELSQNGERLSKGLEDQMRSLQNLPGMKPAKLKVEWTNPQTGEKFIHREKGDGVRHLFYGPPDSNEEKRHGHAVISDKGRVDFNRNPKGE